MLINRTFFVFLFVLGSLVLSAQSQVDMLLAREYLRQKEYSKAVTLYERIYNGETNSSAVFKYYIESLLGVDNTEQAEQVAKKRIRKNKNDIYAYVELGNIYQFIGKHKKADDIYEDIIDKSISDYNKTRQLANLFISRQLFDWAERTYTLAAKNNSGYQLNYELANVYYYQRNYSKMIDAYLALLAIDDKYLNTVKARVNAAVYTDTDDTLIDVLKERLLVMNRDYPSRSVFNELLEWAYFEDKQYELALIQAFALDRRNDEQGERVIRIIKAALQDELYDVVANGAEYILKKGKTYPYYTVAQQLFLSSKYKQIEKGIIYNKSEIQSLVHAYRKALKEGIRGDGMIPLYKDLARIYAFNLHQPDTALMVVEEVRSAIRMSPEKKGEIQLLEADIQLAKGNIFEATLLYAGVERSLSSNPVGYLAKLRKAFMAFYQCDFDWALGQVDVLKASTSKFIANDAARLSMLITENRLEDSVEIPLCMYAKAQLAIHQHLFEDAHKLLDSLIIGFPIESIKDDALLSKANLYKEQLLYKNAVDYYMQVSDNYEYEPKAAEACFFAAQLYENELKESDKAFELYKKILTDYPLSIYQNRARANLRFIRDRLVN